MSDGLLADSLEILRCGHILKSNECVVIVIVSVTRGVTGHHGVIILVVVHAINLTVDYVRLELLGSSDLVERLSVCLSLLYELLELFKDRSSVISLLLLCVAALTENCLSSILVGYLVGVLSVVNYIVVVLVLKVLCIDITCGDLLKKLVAELSAALGCESLERESLLNVSLIYAFTEGCGNKRVYRAIAVVLAVKLIHLDLKIDIFLVSSVELDASLVSFLTKSQHGLYVALSGSDDLINCCGLIRV